MNEIKSKLEEFEEDEDCVVDFSTVTDRFINLRKAICNEPIGYLSTIKNNFNRTQFIPYLRLDVDWDAVRTLAEKTKSDKLKLKTSITELNKSTNKERSTAVASQLTPIKTTQVSFTEERKLSHTVYVKTTTNSADIVETANPITIDESIGAPIDHKIT
jgi:hypothetical protein